MNKFMEVVPKGAKIWAPIVMAALTMIGAVVGFCAAASNHGANGISSLLGVVIGTVGGLAMGAFVAAWMLCLGYVYADAKRRAMRPVLWTLIAALFPHLFGFLLYFALRQPMTPRCTKCGQPVTLDQRFCSWCGAPGPVVGGPEAGQVPAV
ncbi:MAG TPA: zinc ribbon domain-containing protein [Acidobacteriaceae bacterium]|nr:zinc ribbon domain-containing protein [Acidobacteriaceae bacterium]